MPGVIGRRLRASALPGNPALVLFWFARVCSTLAFQMQSVAIGWRVYALTGSALALGLIGLAQFLPMVLLTLPVGHVADRYDRRRIVWTCQAMEAACAAALALGTGEGWLGVAGIYAVVVVLAAARSFEGPTLSAMLPGLAPQGMLQRATALSASANQTASILGPSIGGLLYVAGPTVVFACAAALFLAASCCAAAIRGAARVTAPRERPTLRSLLSGVAFIRARPVILGTISLDLFAVLLGGATALLPIFARDVLTVGSWGLGLLRAAPAMGALTMSLVLARLKLRRAAGRLLFGAVIVFGLATIGFALSRSVALSLLALFVLGASDVISVVIRFALVQRETPEEMRGRVSAVNSMFIGTSNQLGEFESGVTAAWLGAVPATVLGGVGTILVALLWMRIFPQLRRIDGL